MVSQKPKTRAGNQTIAVPDWLMDMLAQHLAQRALSVDDAEAVLFVGPHGRPLDYSNWRDRVWIKAVRNCGLAGLRFHDLRHAAGTAMVTGGVDIKTV